MIKLKNVSKIFDVSGKKLTALDNVSLDIPKGHICGVIGASGAGKSTLIRCVNLLEKPTVGSVIIDGKDLTQLSDAELVLERRNIGMIFQHFSLLERKTVFENVALPMECFKYSKEEIKSRVEELLDLVGILDKKDVKPRNLSGGQKQRVAIARALTMNPSVLLCDEATSALDPKTIKSILDLLQEINQKLGITIVIVTHQMEVIKQVCTRTAIMDAGKVLEVGETEEIFLKNNKPLRKLLGEENIVLPSGCNLKLLFTNDRSNDPVITGMARELSIDVSIIYGKLEKFRENILGSLIINVPRERLGDVEKYLTDHGMRWQEVDNEL